MSAYLVDRHVIAYLTQAAMFRAGSGTLSWWTGGQWSKIEDIGPDRFGQVLWETNNASVNHRYREDKESPDYATHRTPRGFRWDSVQVLKACDCLRYQSYEHPGWEESEACAMLKALTRKAIQALPGYEEAIWGAPEPTARTLAI